MGKLPLDFRYLLTMVFTALASMLYQKGWIGDQATFVSNATAIVVSLVPVATWFYARWVRPSDVGLKAAEDVDKIVAGEKKEATVKTPANSPDLKIAPEKARGGQG